LTDRIVNNNAELMKTSALTLSFHKFKQASSLLAVGLVIASLSACKNQDAVPAPAPAPAKIVKMQEVEAGSGPVSLVLAADIRARIETKLAFRVPGRVSQRLVEIGQLVPKGTPLARLDAQDYQLSVAAARSQQTATEIDAKQAESDLRRLEDLQRKGFVSEAALEQRRSAAAAAQARVAQAKAQSGSQGNQVGYTTLVASETGVVVVRIARQAEKDAVVAVPESQMDQVRKSQPVLVTSSALPGKRFEGVVREISPLADAGTRTFAVKVGLADAQALALGMSAQAQFGPSLAQPAAALVRIPLSALVNIKGQTIVWLVQENKVVERRVSASVAGGENEVLVQGLRAGDRIVVAGGHLLAANDRVQAWVAK
jgi:membrane fusion protein, multidrug efflux system